MEDEAISLLIISKLDFLREQVIFLKGKNSNISNSNFSINMKNTLTDFNTIYSETIEEIKRLITRYINLDLVAYIIRKLEGLPTIDSKIYFDFRLYDIFLFPILIRRIIKARRLDEDFDIIVNTCIQLIEVIRNPSLLILINMADSK